MICGFLVVLLVNLLLCFAMGWHNAVSALGFGLLVVLCLMIGVCGCGGAAWIWAVSTGV